jgi:uncharacterized protein
VTTELEEKYRRLMQILEAMGGVVVAYSGGVDSSLLLKVSVDVLGDRALAVTAESETYPAREGAEAIELARRLGARHRVIHTEELAIQHFADNPPERCYYCKTELFEKLLGIAREEGLAAVADGSNVDDADDYRPGMRAAAELGVRSPLREAGLTKADIRELSKELGLTTWNKPSFACLASRFPYGDQITAGKLQQVAAAETLLRGLQLAQARVRHHGDIARIEVDPSEFELITEPSNRTCIVAELRRLGYVYVTLDLRGYQTGSMNEALDREAAAQRIGIIE